MRHLRQPASHPLHLIVLASIAVWSGACGGTGAAAHGEEERDLAAPAVAREDRSSASPGMGSVDPGAPATGNGDAPRDPEGDTFGDRPLPASRGQAIPAHGACAARAIPGFSFDAKRALSFECRMRSTIATGPAVDPFPLVDGDRGRAVLAGGDLVLRCGTADELLFEATIRCFQGHGVYAIAPGDLKLGAKSSDRSCEIILGARDDAVTGAIACSDAPVDPSNVFAHTWTGTGPSTFELPRTPD